MKLLLPTREIVGAAATLALLVLGSDIATASPTSNTGSYPLSTCIVSGEALIADEWVAKEYDGREARFCCKMCVKDFEKDQVSYLKKLDAAILEAQLANYPLDTCVVSGEPLGEMGDAMNHIQRNRLVRLCCKSCKKDLTADPAKYLSALDAAVVQVQLKDYPTDTCPISGSKLGSMGDPYDYVFAGRLARFCCSGCIDSFDEDPASAMAAIYGAGSNDDGTDENGDHDGHDEHDGHDGDDGEEAHDAHSGHNH